MIHRYVGYFIIYTKALVVLWHPDLYYPASYIYSNFYKKSIRYKAQIQIIECNSSSSNSNVEEEKEDIFYNSNKGFNLIIIDPPYSVY